MAGLKPAPTRPVARQARPLQLLSLAPFHGSTGWKPLPPFCRGLIYQALGVPCIAP